MKRGLLTRIQVAPFELAIAVLLLASGVSYLVDPHSLNSSNVGETIPYPALWAVGYSFAGLLILVGVLLPVARVEAAGLSLTASMVTINAIAATYTGWGIVGLRATIVSLAFYIVLVLASCARLRVLVRGHLVVYAWGEDAKVVVGTAPPLGDDSDR